MKPRLRPCAAFIIAIGAPGSWRAAPAPATAPEPALPATSASPPVTTTTLPPPVGGDAAATAEPSTAAPPSRSLSPKDELDAERESRTRYALGEAAFKAGRYLQAVVEFEAGFEAVPKPGFLLDIGHAYRRLGALHKARAAYKKFLKLAPQDTEQLVGGVVAVIAEYQNPDLPDPHRKRLPQRVARRTAVRKPEVQKPGSRKAGVRNTGHHRDISRSFYRASPSPSISDGRSGSHQSRKLAKRLPFHRILISRLRLRGRSLKMSLSLPRRRRNRSASNTRLQPLSRMRNVENRRRLGSGSKVASIA